MNELIIDTPALADELIFVGGVREYRANCKIGQFVVGQESRGAKLVMELIGVQPIDAQLFNYPRQKWLVVIFADEKKVVSRILFKTESLQNFLEMYREVSAKHEALNTLEISAVMAKRSAIVEDDDGEQKQANYYAVEFAATGPAKYLAASSRFRSQYSELFGEMYAIEKPAADTPPPVLVDASTGEILSPGQALAKS